MFDLEKYYANAFSGEACYDASIIQYINKFQHVILWGASFQGKAIGSKLLEHGVHIENYWDIRSNEIKTCNNIEVVQPFSNENPGQCLVIICIGNRVILDMLIMDLTQHGFTEYIYGDYLYMGLICPFNKKTGIAAKRCSCTMECRQIYCRRIEGILSEKIEKNDPIILPSITLIVNQKCSLRCKYCTSYMNEYPKEDRINFPLERICEDIDRFFAAVDLVGTVTVMGGEPFMHPDISKIIAHLCTKKNFGLISIATSGTYPIKPEQLEGLYDERVNVSFSNYTESITENQKEMFYKNIELLKKLKVCYTVGLFSPEWIIPPTLVSKDIDNEQLVRMKTKCNHWDQIKNGKVHPCDLAMSIYSLGVADYESDYVDLTEEITVEELRKKLKEYIDRPFYESCRYHRSSGGKILTAKAAEQGYFDFTHK